MPEISNGKQIKARLKHGAMAESSTQKTKFIAAARAADCDESEATWEGKLKRIAVTKAKPKKAVKK